MLHGIDLSHYQGNIDFDVLVKEVDFVIIKSTEGCPDPGQNVASYEDPQFKHYQSESRRVNLLRGYYHYARPDYNDPEPEAAEFVNAIEGLKLGEIMCLDFEQATNKDIVDWCKRWLDKVASLTSTLPLIYLNENLITSHNWTSVYNAGYGLWVAKYGVNDGSIPPSVNTGVWPTAAFWQYTSVATVAGIHPVDADNFYGDMTSFAKYGYTPNNVPTSTSPSTPSPTLTPSNPLQTELDVANAKILQLNQELVVWHAQASSAYSKGYDDCLAIKKDPITPSLPTSNPSLSDPISIVPPHKSSLLSSLLERFFSIIIHIK